MYYAGTLFVSNTINYVMILLLRPGKASSFILFYKNLDYNAILIQ